MKTVASLLYMVYALVRLSVFFRRTVTKGKPKHIRYVPDVVAYSANFAKIGQLILTKRKRVCKLYAIVTGPASS